MKPLHFLINVTVFLISASSALAQNTLTVNGSYTGNQFWNADTIKVVDNVSVCGTLNIAPGTYVEFQGHYEILADSIFALGSQADSITFTIKDTTGFSLPGQTEGSWKGLHADDYMDLDYCRIMFVKNYCILFFEGKRMPGYLKNSYFSDNHCNYLVTCKNYYVTEPVGKMDIKYTSFVNNQFGLGLTRLIDGCRFTGNSCQISGQILNSCFERNKKLIFPADEYNQVGIKYCTFKNNDSLGITSSTFGSLGISSCLFAHNNNTFFSGITHSEIDLINNTFFNNHVAKGYNGLINISGGGLCLLNNIMYAHADDSSQSKFVSFNDHGKVLSFSGFVFNNMIEGGQDAFEGTGTFKYKQITDLDPLFIDTLNHDFHLAAQSPGINSGYSDIHFHPDTYDLDGNQRIYGNRIDIGAYEFQGKPDNRPPIIELFGTPRFLPGIANRLTVRFFDPDSGDICIVSNVISKTPKVKADIIAADSNSVKINITADHDWQGTGHILIQVADNHDHVASYEFQVIVSKVVCGELSPNTVWGGDTVNVECDVILDNYDTLTIQPGTTVTFAKNCRLIVKGMIKAVGNDSSRITFTASDTNGFYLDDYIGWGGISNYERNQDNSSMGIFRYCDFQYATSNSEYKSTLYWRTDHSGNSLIVANCRFFNNHSGAIFIHSQAIIQNSIFYNNKAGYGGAINIDYPSVDIFNCKFFNNTAERGGAIYGTPKGIRNCLFINNSAKYGGAIASDRLKIINSTLSGNNAEINGGGAECRGDGIVINCIFWNNHAGLSGNEIQQDYGTLVINNSIIKGGINGISYSDLPDTNFIYSANPYFKNSAANDFHLSDSSLAINTGTTDTTGLYLPATDLDGSPRITDHYIDIGAYEYHFDSIHIGMQPEGFIACSGDEGQLVIHASGIVTGYQWQKNGTDLPGATGSILQFPSLKLSDEGIYRGMAKNACTSDTTGPVVVKVNPLPSPNLGNDTAFCANATKILASKITYPKNTWNTGSQDDSIVISSSGIYWLAVTDANGCSNTDSISVTINPMPYAYLGNDTSINTADTLYLNAGDGFENYLWNTSNDDQLLLIHKNQPGDYEYWVMVTDTNGCSSGDSIIVKVEQATQVYNNPLYSSLKIYPNPTTGILNLISEMNLEDVSIEIYDMKGQRVLLTKINQLKAGEVYTLNLSGLLYGVYEMRAGEKIIKIIKK